MEQSSERIAIRKRADTARVGKIDTQIALDRPGEARNLERAVETLPADERGSVSAGPFSTD
jgi:hypothetical protein